MIMQAFFLQNISPRENLIEAPVLHSCPFLKTINISTKAFHEKDTHSHFCCGCCNLNILR